MRTLVQRVSHASVRVEGELISSIQEGFLIFVGIHSDDNQDDIDWLANKIAGLRVFNDDAGKFNLSLADIEGSMLVVSQFTLFASTKKGFRPSFTRSAPPEIAIPLYEKFAETIAEKSGRPVSTGVFGANMDVDLLNQGPVTIMIDSRARE
ncbi:MAG: D-tyrosyl-tRNA(Tyr) deacylase [Planctomycetes bacterium]|nr:D-tyrosyl-tRNA(Tyr) deacylase [Planctomycetota bacterium]